MVEISKLKKGEIITRPIEQSKKEEPVRIQSEIRFLEVQGQDPKPAGEQALIVVTSINQSNAPKSFYIELFDRTLNSEVATRFHKMAQPGMKLINRFWVTLASGDNPFQLRIIHDGKILSTADLVLTGL